MAQDTTIIRINAYGWRGIASQITSGQSRPYDSVLLGPPKWPVISYSLVNIVDFLGLAQGCLLGGILVLAHRRETRPTRLLGWFLLTYTLEIIPSLLNDLGLSEQQPFLYWLPVNFYFLSAPLLFLYARRMTGQLRWRKDWKHLLPGAVEFLLLSAFLLLEAGGKDRLFTLAFTENFQAFYFLAGLLYMIAYLVKTLVLLRKHARHILHFHADLRGKQLGWLRLSVWLLLAFVGLLLIPIFWDLPVAEATFYLLITTLNVIVIYFIAVSGIRQLSFRAHTEEEARPQVPTIGIKEQSATQLAFQRLEKLMAEERPYLNPQLTISDLSRKLGVSERSLSRIVNQEGGNHFNGYINHYRVEAAKELLSSADYDHYTMDGIAMEAGFKAKATFYTAFKRVVGSSPGQFKKGLEARV